MTRFGYTLMTEQSGPKELVGYAARAEEVGFDFEVSSDHFFPWLDTQGHAPYAWSVLGAGENLNEHVVGERWPAVGERHDMLEEAIAIIRGLLRDDGDVTWEGDHFRVDSARLWDVPDDGVEIAVAVSGEESVERFAALADHLVVVEPDGDLFTSWNAERARVRLAPSRAIGQIPISWGPDLDAVVEAVSACWMAGFTDVALVQIGDELPDHVAAPADTAGRES